MADDDFESYSRHAVHFFHLDVPKPLRSAVESRPDAFHFADLGCGDGQVVYALRHHGLLERAGSVTGVDLSPLRIERFTAHTGYPGVVSDGEKVEQIADDTLDIIVNTMVIEHVPDDVGLLREIKRMLRTGGRVYLSTVIAKKGSWYFRKSPDGRRVLDPTHLREYPSREAVETLFHEAGLTIEDVTVTRLVFPILYPLLRWTNAIVPIPGINKLFLTSRVIGSLGKVGLPIPRYRCIEVVASKP